LEEPSEVLAFDYSLAELEPGSGHSVLLGLDNILGLGNSSFLSHQLISELKRNNMVYLYQAIGKSRRVFCQIIGKLVRRSASVGTWQWNGMHIVGN
jgi:hypothetical protein